MFDRNIFAGYQPLQAVFRIDTLEYPVLATYRVKILMLNPVFVAITVPSARPAPEQLPDAIVDIAKRPFGNNMTMIICPTPRYWIKLSYQVTLFWRRIRFTISRTFWRRLRNPLATGFISILPQHLRTSCPRKSNPSEIWLSPVFRHKLRHYSKNSQQIVFLRSKKRLICPVPAK